MREPPPPHLSLGPSDFAILREPGVLFVDKSDFIRRVVFDTYQTLLFPRPRRFGKSTNLSMLGYFLGKSDRTTAPCSRTCPSGARPRPGLTSSATRSSPDLQGHQGAPPGRVPGQHPGLLARSLWRARYLAGPGRDEARRGSGLPGAHP